MSITYMHICPSGQRSKLQGLMIHVPYHSHILNGNGESMSPDGGGIPVILEQTHNRYLTCVISNRGHWENCNVDKKHRCFIWEITYELNSVLNQRYNDT